MTSTVNSRSIEVSMPVPVASPSPCKGVAVADEEEPAGVVDRQDHRSTPGRSGCNRGCRHKLPEGPEVGAKSPGGATPMQPSIGFAAKLQGDLRALFGSRSLTDCRARSMSQGTSVDRPLRTRSGLYAFE